MAACRPEAPLSPAAFQGLTNVSRETMARLERYVALLEKWQRAINLVSRGSLGDVWRRHVLDSAQLRPLIPDSARVLVDLGSGAGFPGLVLAILGVERVHLMDSDARKCAFLREAARETGTEVEIHHGRIEAGPGFGADVVTARALAALPDLLELASPFLRPHSICVFLKGQGVDDELTAARQTWNMGVRRQSSASDPSGTILCLEHVHRERAS